MVPQTLGKIAFDFVTFLAALKKRSLVQPAASGKVGSKPTFSARQQRFQLPPGLGRSVMRDFATVEEINLKVCLAVNQRPFASMRLCLYSICFGHQNGIKIKPVVVSSTQVSSCQA